MAREEDILLKEVDEQLQQDRAVAFFKQNGPYLAGAAIAVIAAVAGAQIFSGMRENARAEAATAYWAAVEESEASRATGADALRTFARQTEGGYAGLAELRAAALLFAEGEREAGLEALQAVRENGALPDRIRDIARLRTAVLVLDQDPAAANSLATEVETPAFAPFAKELRAVALMAQQDYQTAAVLLGELRDDPAVPPSVLARVDLLAPVADAARKGVTLEPTTSDAEDFIRSFSESLERQEAEPETDGAAEPDGE
jgi:hypothetical protein